MSSSPTSRTLKLIRDLGYSAEVTEKWIPGAYIRKDLFGFIDIIAIKLDEPDVGIQATSISNMSARRLKIAELADAVLWFDTKHRIWVVGWEKRKNRWVHRVDEMFMAGGEWLWHKVELK